MGQRVFEPGAEAMQSSAASSVGKADRTGYHLKALQEIRNSLRPFATENGGSTSPTIHQQSLYPSYQGQHGGSGYSEVTSVSHSTFNQPICRFRLDQSRRERRLSLARKAPVIGHCHRQALLLSLLRA